MFEFIYNSIAVWVSFFQAGGYMIGPSAYLDALKAKTEEVLNNL